MYCDDRSVNISTVAAALIALEAEIEKLDQDAAMMHKRLALITAKQRICVEAIQVFLSKIQLANKPEHQYVKIGELIHDSQIQNWSKNC